MEGYLEYTAEQYMERAITNGISASVSVGGEFKIFSAEASGETSYEETNTSGSS